MTIGIYRITNIIDGKFYIGSSTNIERRFVEHTNALNKDKHHNAHLQAVWNKYGSTNFTFEIIDTIKESIADKIFSLEEFYLAAVADWSQTYNVAKYTKNWTLDLRYAGSKYYTYDKDKKLFIVSYRIKGVQHRFGTFETEEKAIEQVKHILTLNQEQLIDYLESVKDVRFKSDKNRKIGNQRAKYFKGYYYEKTSKRWRVRIIISGKKKSFGQYKTEQEAIDKVNEIKLTLI